MGRWRLPPGLADPAPPGGGPARPARPRRRLAVLGSGCVVVVLLLLGVLVGTSRQQGRTPAELLRLAQPVAASMPLVHGLAAPLLGHLADALADLADVAAGTPAAAYTVPPLPPNPAGSRAPGQPPQATGGAAAPAEGRRLQVGPQRALRSPAAAAAVAQDGDTVEIDPGDYRGDVAVWTQHALTIRGMGQGMGQGSGPSTGPQVRLIADGASAEGKATWVVRGGRVTIEGIQFIGSRVPDHNGAGIRFERGHLSVRRCLFFDNQSGILTASAADAVLEVEQSEFSHNGHGDGLSHHLYAGPIAQLTVRGSYFHHANVGHLIKSRAASNLIAYNRLTDEAGGRASYELEFPNGGQAVVVGNLLQQGSQTSNSTMVSFGAEGWRWPQSRLQMAFNTLVNDQPFGGSFVRVWPGAAPALLQDNLLLGSGTLLLPPDAVQQRNHRLLPTDLVNRAGLDYRLTARGRLRLPTRTVGDTDPALWPNQQYSHPTGLHPLDGPTRFPGALQPAAP